MRKIFVHPFYVPDVDEKKRYNIALLFLEKDFELNENMNVVCLPSEQSYDDYIPETCVATGFGERPEGQNLDDFQETMKALHIPIITKSTCENWLDKFLGKNVNRVSPSQFCAGIDGSFETDTCEGDGGGPLVCNKRSDPNTFVQMGVTSARVGDAPCGTTSVPGLYSKVSNRDIICMIKSAIECDEVGQKYAAFFEDQKCSDNYIEDYKAKIENSKFLSSNALFSAYLDALNDPSFICNEEVEPDAPTDSDYDDLYNN